MLNLQGYLCLCKILHDESLVAFGPGRVPHSFGNLRGNGLRLWPEERDADQGARYILSDERFRRVSICRLSLHLVEDKNDLDLLENSHSLIVIGESRWIDELAYEFYGPIVEGRPKALPIPAAYLTENGLRPFNSFREADYVAGELWRQGLARVMLAEVVEFKSLRTELAYLASPPSPK